MKQKRKLSSKIAFLILALVILVSSLMVIMTSAANEIEVVGDMQAIKTAFDEKYLTQDTVRAKDEYVGTIQYTVYYDKSLGAIKTGYEGTPIILYSINHPEIERIGTDSDTSIIQSMLDRGYVVIVVDYLNSKKATTPNIEASAQTLRQSLRGGIGDILTNKTYFPTGIYPENFLAPSGYNVNLFNVFWEIDKHSAEGTLEKIVENWNSDFRATKGSKLLKWATGDTVDTRKAVQNDLDGNAPVWYDASGKADANGLYTYVKFTKAETITDCVDPDGSFLDMNLYIHIVYPTNPKNEVPVMALANSTGYPTTTVGTDSAYLRPHSNGFLYNGYVNVVFDYLWQPMARSASWGYYDGSGGNTKDHMNYGLMMYNDKLVNTAAMRYLRYLSLSGGTEYNFDLDAFGVYGNSKGGWFSFLGEEVLQSELVDASKYSTTAELEEAINAVVSSFVPDRYYKGHHGETRYQVGAGVISANGFTLNAGEKQPWLTYNGKELLSGAQLTNACNGSQEEDITAGHSPIFISGNMTDDYNAAYSYSVNIYNICRELNIPLLHFEVPIGHTLTEGIDMNYNVDTYEAFFRYVNYYLKKTPISVAYISPMNNAGNVSVTDKITVYFAGAVTPSEIEKITVTSANGTVSGAWESSFGGTTWTFTPDELIGSTLYTVTVPKTLKGDNGVEMGTDYTASFLTELDNKTATAISGSYHTVTVPALTTGNSFVFRFHVSNDAVNVAELYAVSAEGETAGEYLGNVKVNGSGSYEIDITDFAVKNSGKSVVLYLKTAKAAGNYNVFTSDPFDTHSPANTTQIKYTSGAEIDGETAFKVVIENPTTPSEGNKVSYYYSNVTSVFLMKNIVGSATTAENEGKRFVISFDIYDTADRVFEFRLKTMTSRTDYGTIDYDNVFFNVKTKANEWTHVEFTYDVYETKYGFASEKSDRSVQFGEFCISPTGDTAMPVYFNNLQSVEILTDLDVTSASIAEKNDGTGMNYTPAASTSPFALYDGTKLVGEYAGWKAALAAYKAGYTVKLQSDYTFTDADITNVLGNFAVVNVDFGNYTVTSANTKNSLLYAYANNTSTTTVNVSGGAILLNRTALISYEGSTSSGSGKTFNINLNGTYIGLTDNAYTTEIISAVSTTSGVNVNASISLDGCTVDLPDANHAHDAFTVFTNPTTTTLKVKYTVIGGVFKLTSQRWATLSENANIVEFKKNTSGKYTVLVMPKSNTYAITGSYLNADGFATYVALSEESNMVTYALENSASSTKYGIITDTYADASVYPFVVFKDGNLIGGYADFKAAIDAAAKVLNGKTYVDSEAQVLMRANASTTKEVTLGASAGTIVVDLGGFTLTRDKNPASAVVNGDTVFDYATGILYKNGRFEMNHSYNTSKGTYSAGLLGATHVLKEVTKVKTFNVTYENITFGFADGYYSALNTNGLLWAVWQNSYKSETITNLTLNDCIFDFTKNAPTGKNLISASGAYAHFNIAINGGEIRGNASAYSLVVKDAEDSFVLGKNSKGEYLKLASGATPTTDSFYCDDGVYRVFGQTDSGYELIKNPLSTDYGAIETKYTDTEKYPFALFTNGAFIGAYTHWANTADTDASDDNKDVVQRAKDQVGGASNAGKVTTIYLRRDYALDSTSYSLDKYGAWQSESFNNYSQVGGTIIVDLGGNTLTLGAKVFMPSTAKATSSVIHNTKFKFINGTIELNDQPLIEYGSSDSLTSSKNFDYTFENVTFVLSADKGANLVKGGAFNGTATLNANIEFTNCTFDYSKVSTEAFTLFNIGSSKLAANVTFNGGHIISSYDALSKITISSLGNNGKVTFGKLDGKYITLTTPTTAAYENVHYKGAFNTPEGTMYFIEMVDDGTNSYYELLPMSFGDLSATITAKYLSAVDYPFFIFSNGVFKSANTCWRAAIDAAESHVDAESEASNIATIILRRDYDIVRYKADGTTNLDGGANFNDARGKIVLDMCGYTMTSVDKAYFIDISISYKSTATYLGFTSTLEVKNGKLVNSRTGDFPLIGIGHSSNTAADDTKQINFIFNNVTFAYGSTTPKVIIDEFPDKTGDGINVYYVFNGCVVDFTNAATGAVAFDFKDNKTTTVSSAQFNGCTIIANKLSDYTFVRNNTNDTIVFGKYNGVYGSLVQLTESTAPTLSYKNADGTSLIFGKESTSGNYTTYLLGEPIKTPYGDIPFTYQSTELYPFVYFDENGNFKHASAYLYGANMDDSVIGKAKDYLSSNSWNGESYGDSPKAAYILMRRDYTMASNEYYNNLAQIKGVITIDLNGYTFTMNDSKNMFGICVKPWNGAIFLSQIDTINGTIALSSKSLSSWNAWDASGTDVSNKQFILNFTDVKFILSSKTTTPFIAYTAHDQTPTADAAPAMNFNNCTFDLTNAPNGTTLFNLGNDYIYTSVTVNGGEIISKSANFVMFTKSKVATSNLVFGSYNGSYTVLTLPVGATVPGESYMTDTGVDCIFNKSSELDGTATYVLCPAAVANYKIKTSITLWSNFVYNIYIPTADFNKATVNGEAVTYTEVEIDGVSYYHISIKLPAGEALSDIKLVVTINNGDSTIDATWTLNVLNYTKLVLAGDFTDVTKTLMKDMLAYALSAHNYFENTEAEADKLLEVEKILEGYNATLPTGTAKKPTSTAYFTDVAVHVGAVPSFRFYLADGYTKNDFTFKVGGSNATAKSGSDDNGNYVEITMYAHMMLKDVTYTVVGNGASESYNIFSYYEYAKALGDAKLVSVVEGLMKYSSSAIAYRDEVIGK